MAIKSGQILHDAHGFVIDRIQSAGAGTLNIPEEKVYELGNYQTVATVRDIPDLSFDLESFDVSTEIESILLSRDPGSVVDGDEFDFINAVPTDIISPFKSTQGQFDAIRGIILPFLTLDSVTYRFGLRQNATQQFTLRGDTVLYTPGTPYYEEFAGDGTTTVFNLAHNAIPYVDGGDTIYVVGVCFIRADGSYKRLFFGEDYTNTVNSFTLSTAAPAGSTIRVVYASTATATYPQAVHEGVAVKPAAVRGKDIDVYIGTADATPVFERWTGVQSVEVSRSVNIENDEEFGNRHFVASEYDTADVTGTIAVKPVDVEDLWEKIHTIANVPSNEIVGPLTSVALPVEIRISDPDNGNRLKTLYIPDARFKVPGVQGRVQQKLEVNFEFTSDTGQLLVYSGSR